MKERPDLAPLYAWYRERLLAHGVETCSAWSYHGNYFEGGPFILNETRKYYFRRPALQAALPAPFASSKLRWINRYFRLRKIIYEPALQLPVKLWTVLRRLGTKTR